MTGPLSGFRILELTTTVAGPTVGMILGDQGADIIKIEPPLIGDLGRFMGPSRAGLSSMFATLNRNKRSLVLDFKQEAELAMFLELVKTADVLVENYRPGVVEKLGIDYASLSAINPGLVYCSISGYGGSGPYQRRRVYDPLVQATAGASAAQGPGRPTNVRSVVFDKVTGITASQSVTAALLQRERTGRGEHLDISMLKSALYFQWPDVMWSHTYQGDGVTEAGVLADWFQVYKACDGYIAIILVTDAAFGAACELLGVSLHEDPRFLGLRDRLVNREALTAQVDAAIAGWSAAELAAALDERDVPVAVVNSLDAIFDDPQVVQQQAVRHTEHPEAGPMRLADTPFNFDEQSSLPARHAPVLGQHSREILEELGVDEAEIARMESREAQNRELMRDFTLENAK